MEDLSDIEFHSLLAQSKGQQLKGSYEKGVYGAYMHFQRMIRKDDMKLLVYPEANKLLLFDLKNDPLETKDLSMKEDKRKLVTSLFKDLQDLQVDLGDTLDLSPVLESFKSFDNGDE
jgi:arylsulfatase A-like enzyme